MTNKRNKIEPTSEKAPAMQSKQAMSSAELGEPTGQFPGFRSFQTESKTDSTDAASRVAAERILASPTFFTECLDCLRRMGLVGEQKNALALYLVCTSRLLPRPINAFVKGHSSSGKNFLVSRVLGLFPEDSYIEVTSASEKTWHYSADSFQNKIVYVQEQNKASGSERVNEFETGSVRV
jgi:hypothetical protein